MIDVAQDTGEMTCDCGACLTFDLGRAARGEEWTCPRCGQAWKITEWVRPASSFAQERESRHARN